MRILITGGLGFIGSNLLHYLAHKKEVKNIIVLDNFSKANLTNLDKNLKYTYFSSARMYKKSKSRIVIIKANINNEKLATKITKDVDYVVHLAAESGVDTSLEKPRESFNTNVSATFNYLESSKINKIKRFIFASSCAVFGDSKPPYNENLARNPISPYASGKLGIETFCESYSNVFNLNTTILRFSNAYGNYSKHKKSVISKFIQDIIKNKPLNINGDGSITRDFIHVDDICDAIYKCIKSKKGLQIYHVATGKETSINSLVGLMKKIFKKYNKNNIVIKYKKERVGDMQKNYSSISKIKKEINWKNKTSLNKGLEKTIKWYL